jgi:multidrug efflux pump
MEKKPEVFKEFKPTSWSIDNKITIFVLSIIVTLAGLMSYNALPKEKFPDIVIPTIYVATVYPGNSPSDMEKISKQIEKQVKSISGIKKIKSTSIQDFSNVVIEFSTDVPVPIAKQKVEDAVNRAKPDLPTDLPRDPMIIEVDFSEMPILFVNLSGKYPLQKLKEFAEQLEDKIEMLPEITRVDIVGGLEREIQINVDINRMQAAHITLGDIERAVAYENLTISGGLLTSNGVQRSISVSGEFTDTTQIKNIVIRSMSGSTTYLHEIAKVVDGHKDQESFARLNHENVVTLNIIKKSGQNLINASDFVRDIVDSAKVKTLPADLKVTLTGDQSNETRVTLADLINTIIIGFVLVTFLLMFFMGVTNALFVALSVPLSMFIAFLVLPGIGFSLNMIVLFSFLLALGIVVDDAIVVVENTHRLFENGKRDIVKAAKMAAGEVFVPVFSGTLTVIAPFFPLAFWGGIIGKFMFFLPITLIITLFASLLVAYIFNPVFAAQFMKKHGDPNAGLTTKQKRGTLITCVVFGMMAFLFFLGGSVAMGTFTITVLLFFLLIRFVLEKVFYKFQHNVWPNVLNFYQNILHWVVRGKNAIWVLVATIAIFVLSIFLVTVAPPKVVFFPEGDPNFVYCYINLPVGTDVRYTDSITRIVENRVFKVIGEKNPVVSSVISNVAVGATDPMEGDRSVSPQKGKVSISFVEFSKRNGESTLKYLEEIRAEIKDIPGVQVTVEQEKGGPPTAKPINIEITGDNLDELVSTSVKLKRYLDSLQIPGVEELKNDLMNKKPELTVTVDHEQASREGISTAQIGMEIRNIVFGKEVSKFRDKDDDYPIMMRFTKVQREDIETIKSHKITYRDMVMGGMMREIPLSSLVKIEESESYGGIRRLNQKRIITLGSNVLSAYNGNEVVKQIEEALKGFPKSKSVTVTMTGEQEDQKETGAFLGNAMMISLGMIFLILVTQFNSVSKTMIIISEILFSVIGVMLGFVLTGMEMSIVMTGIGIVALAGIVVRNGILMVEFIDALRERGYGLREAIPLAASTRLTPVLLTATATMLGLIPLAVGLNIDFYGLFAHGNPDIFFGGDNVKFWGPLSWTIIFGLSFATFLTLFLVPAMYLISEKAWERIGKLFGMSKKQHTEEGAIENASEGNVNPEG